MGALGLTSEQAETRRRDGRGNDEPPSTSRPVLQILRTNILTRFNAILAALLAVIIVIGPFQDGLFGVILIVNTLLGVGQELRAKHILDQLAVVSSPHVRVWRDGALVEMAVEGLVIDDVVALRRGEQIPLDGAVLDGTLEIDESLLTGESEPVGAPAGATLHSGSFVVAGSGTYVVERVGADSYAQRVAGEARVFALATSELRDGVDRFLQVIEWALIPIAALLIISQLITQGSVRDAIRGSVAGISAMVPAGLILLTTVAFAVGVIRLARRRVLVQELPAVEGLARVDVLCVDKTGTLTTGAIELDTILPVGDATIADAEAALGALAHADAEPNPTLSALAAQLAMPEGWDAVRTVPFTSARRWSGADFGPHGVWLLGAPEVLESAKHASVVERTGAGYRVVVLARAQGLDPVGAEPCAILHLREQIRPDAAETLEFLRRRGVDVKVLSGDNPATVGAIAAALGIAGADQPVDASTLGDEDLTSHSVFGRVSPQDKRRIVRALKDAGHTVAMTGDGVNDVLALKDADIGIAMGSGSPVSRGVAQLVLLDDDFSAVPAVVGEGRRVMANVERVSNLFLTKTVYAALIAVVIGFTGVAYPFLPRHLTIVDDFTIGAPAFLLALLPNDQPFRPGFVERVLRFVIPCGAVCGVAALVAYLLGREAGLSLVEQRTMTTITIVACGLWVLLVIARPLDRIKGLIVAAAAIGFVAMLAVAQLRTYFALHVPPALQLWECVLITAVAIPTLEAVLRATGYRPQRA